MEYAELNNGVKMPMLGYGVYQTPPEETERCVLEAVDVGYRSIDTAQAYGNEEGVGSALAKSGLPREEFFLHRAGVWKRGRRGERAGKERTAERRIFPHYKSMDQQCRL